VKKKLQIALVGLVLAASSAITAPSSVSAETHISAAAPSIGNDIIAAGMKYLGTPYLFGADPSQTRTFDCLSFTFRAFTENGINLPRTANQQYSLGKSVALSDAQPGDLIFFRDSVYPDQAGHVSIYMGGGRMLHASTGKGVNTIEVAHPYWKKKIIGIKRVIPAAYTVQNGDTLWRISLAHGVTVQELRNWNKLKQDGLMKGQQLMVENPDLLMSQIYAKGRSYMVQPGDSLWSISRKMSVTVDQLQSWNGILQDEVYVGQRLKLEAPFKTYTVAAGDSIWSVSNKTRTPEAAIKKANPLSSDSIYVGQVLNIPVSF
jgi:LysM repeat protein